MVTKLDRGTAIVTGASSGIGEIYAERLADRGYDLVLVARGREKLETLANRIKARTGRKIDVLPADLGKAEGRSKVERRLHEDKTVTLLVNNAGTTAGGPRPLADSDLDAIEDMIAINITALTRLAGVAATAFGERKRGTIINISSAMAFIPAAAAAVYAASKAYVLHFSLALRDGVAEDGVHVQAVLPGYTHTPLLTDAMLSAIPAEMIMPVEELVDAALAGLDQGETITIPSLPDTADWTAFETARQKLASNASRDRPAARYRETVAS